MWKSYAALIALNVPLYVILARLFFHSLDDFCDAIYFWVRPDILSLFSGEFWTDHWNEMKLGIWVALCMGLTHGEISHWPNLLPWLNGMFS